MKAELDFRSATWAAVREYAAGKLNEARIRNDGALTPDQTSTLRGGIAAYKAILALETAPEIVVDE